jgi:hypothetical protein
MCMESHLPKVALCSSGNRTYSDVTLHDVCLIKRPPTIRPMWAAGMSQPASHASCRRLGEWSLAASAQSRSFVRFPQTATRDTTLAPVGGPESTAQGSAGA